MLAGFLGGSIAVLEASTPMFVVGAVLIAVGALMASLAWDAAQEPAALALQLTTDPGRAFRRCPRPG